MSRMIDLTGRKVGRLLVLHRTARYNAAWYWLCRCDCGRHKEIRANRLLAARAVKSCGCQHREAARERRVTHDKSQTKEYRIWGAIKTRCYNPSQLSYRNYGARGIQMCDEWRASFEAFLRDMGRCPEGCSIDRIDFNGNYAPGNCRWASRMVQANNTRANRFLELDGQRHTINQWARISGLNRETIKLRLARGWPVRKALTTPKDATRSMYVTLDGDRRTLAEWAEYTGLGKATIAYRLKHGWDVARALGTPSQIL